MNDLKERVAVLETKVENVEGDIAEIRKDIKYIRDNDLAHIKRGKRYWGTMATMMTAVATIVTYLYNLACTMGWI